MTARRTEPTLIAPCRCDDTPAHVWRVVELFSVRELEAAR